MKHQNARKIKVILFSFALAWIFLPVHSIFAQQITLSLDPPLIETIMKPGKSILIAYSVENLGDPTALQFRIRPFTPAGNQGSVIVEEETGGPVVFSLDNSDIQIEKPFFFSSKKKQQAVVRISVPDGTPEGDYYYMILAETVPAMSVGGTSSGIAQASVGSPLLISVSESGVIEVKANIESLFIKPRFTLRWGRKTISFVDSSDTIPLTCIVKNSGKHLVKPEGTLSIRTGKKETSYPLLSQNILSSSSRIIKTNPVDTQSPEYSLDLRGFGIGRHVVSASITFGNSQISLAQTEFYALPFRFAIILCALLFVVFVFFRLRKKKKVS